MRSDAWEQLIRVPVHTVGWMVLGAGVLALFGRENPGGLSSFRRRLALAAGIGTLTVSFLIWQALLLQERGQITRTIENETRNLRITIEEKFETEILALVRIVQRWEFRGGTPREEWERAAALYLAHQPGLYAVAWVDPSFHIRWAISRSGDSSLIAMNLASDPEQRGSLEAIRNRREVVVRGSLSSPVDDHNTFPVYVPIFSDDIFGGFILGVFHVPELLDAPLSQKTALGYRAAVFEGEQELYRAQGGDREYEEPWGQEARIALYEVSWRLRMWPSSELLTQERSSLPHVVFLLGLLMASLLTATVYLGQTASLRATALEREIQEREYVQQTLKKSQARYQDLYDNAPDMILSVDSVSRKIIACNQTLLDTTGYTGEEIIGRSTLDFLYTSDSLEAARKMVQQFRTTGEVRHAELRIRCKDGSTVEISSNISSVRDEQGNIRFSRNIWRDITELKRAREDVRKLNEELEERVIQRTEQLEAANRELEGFSYSVSHDLRAPLRHMGGFLDLLRKHAGPSLDEKSGRYLGVARESAQKMGQLIDDLLDFSRIARVETKKSQVNMNQLVKEVQGQIEDRDIVWTVAALPEVRADPSMMRLVIQNLIDNAVKYTRTREKVEIEIGHSSNGEELVFFIRDNGVGFDMQYVDKLFGVFQRLHRKEEFEGTGIGLANVKRIIHRHGGRVWAKGKVNEGATLYFSLPKEEKHGSNEANSAG